MKNLKKIAAVAACAALAGSMTAGAVRLPTAGQGTPSKAQVAARVSVPSASLGQLLHQICSTVRPPMNRPNCDTDSVPDLPNILPGLPGQLPAPDGGSTPEKPPVVTPELSAQAAEVVRLVNDERAKAGLPALKTDARAAAAAQVRAGELKKSFSHTRPSGAAYATALTEAGASFRSSGENIAYGQKNAAAVMQSWMNSAGHRANILSEKFTAIGVGYAVIGGQTYWTQLLIG